MNLVAAARFVENNCTIYLSPPGSNVSANLHSRKYLEGRDQLPAKIVQSERDSLGPARRKDPHLRCHTTSHRHCGMDYAGVVKT
jgi:hypothetical protein